MNNILSYHSKVPFGDEVLETAYEAVAAELETLAPEEVLHLNLDIFASVNTAVGTIFELQALRAQILEELPKFDLERFDKLHRYAMALAYAHTTHLLATRPRSDLRPIFEEAVKLRGLLLGDVRALVNRGIVSAELLRNLKGAVGYKNVQLDLQMLVSICRTHWATVRGRCATDESELERGEKLVIWLIEVAGRRGRDPKNSPETADLRARAFTLFMRAYDDARRAVAFLRWKEGDADSIAPSLFTGRPNGKRKAKEAVENGPRTGEPVTERNEASSTSSTSSTSATGAGLPLQRWAIEAPEAAPRHQQASSFAFGLTPVAHPAGLYPGGPYAEPRPPPGG